jgi:murein L,D-transpeptidase YafK
VPAWKLFPDSQLVLFMALRILAVLAFGFLLSGCVSVMEEFEDRGNAPIPMKLVNQMSSNGMTVSDPVLVRIFKEESELEVWKRDRTGRFALLKTYPMCRWSGKLGPKTTSGDRQAPEGFYHVTASMLNPQSQYHLSFNLGYPNRLEAALGYTGDSLMVHGACSSSGCFAMTDEGVGEIYAVVRDAIRGGQQSVQVQSFPFRMTARNMARHRGDPNTSFWENLKEGYDIFEATRRQPQVSACGRRYVFDTMFPTSAPLDPLAACPAGEQREDPLVASRQAAEESAYQMAISGGNLTPIHAYSDGGMHETFRSLLEKRGVDRLSKLSSRTEVPVSRPEAALADPHRIRERP